MSIKDPTIFNVFDHNLIRGKEKFPDFMRHRKFAYVEPPSSSAGRSVSPQALPGCEPPLISDKRSVSTRPKVRCEHPVDGWRVFLRACAFISIEGLPGKDKFLVVKGTSSNKWEPPKGLLEGDDMGPRENILKSLTRLIRREIEEEAAVHHVQSIKYTGLVLQGQEASYPTNWYFQYHVFHVVISQSEWTKIQEHFNWIAEHPASFARLKRDYREKNAVAIYDPVRTSLTEPIGKALVDLYLKN